MADCDMCRTEEFRNTWLGPKHTIDLNAKLMWVCESCREGKEIVHTEYPVKPWYWFMPYAGLTSLTVLLVTLVVVLWL